jgi:uncharacterized protein
VPRKRSIRIKCPTCKQPVQSDAADFPFCSPRCRVIDLGKWASGQYVVSSSLPEESDLVNNQSFPGEKDEG